MILVIGGAYQGKLEFAKEKFNINEEEIYYCSERKASLDFDKKLIYNINLFVLAMLKNKKDPINYIKENLKLFEEKIVVCEDIFCGIVPEEQELKNLMKNLSCCLNILSINSLKIVRLFCGIPLYIK